MSQIRGMRNRPAEREGAPCQYSTLDRCTDCQGLLSRYNPYTICGPCRFKLAGRIAAEMDGVPDCVCHGVICHCGYDGRLPWEKLPKRKAVSRGPLLAETMMSDFEA